MATNLSIDDEAPSSKKQKLEIDLPKKDGEEVLKAVTESANEGPQGETNLSETCTSRETTDIAPSKVVVETDIGMTQYVSSHEGFSAIIKQRYSDFIVNEIDENGTTVQLTTRDVPPAQENKGSEPVNTDALCTEDRDKLQKLLDDPDKKASVYIQATCDKETRTAMHKAIKSLFPSLNSNTVEEDGKKMLKISKIKSDRRERPEWPSGQGHYCRFILYKENKDTMDAISLISKLARLKTHLFRYAGTKDKRAKTSQEITAHKVTANKISALNAKLRNMMVGNFRYVKDSLTLGQLKGNHFIIVLRNVTGTEEQISTAMTALKTSGFINYYGMQRFGTTSIPTHHVGRALLKGKWEEAVDLILKPRCGEDESMQKCREAWGKSRDPSKALKFTPGHHSIERTLLQALVNQGERNFAGALQAIPRNTRLMYVHAYQSYVWNSVTSRYLLELGSKVKVGDLVLQRADNSNVKEGDVKKVDPIVVTASNQSEYTIQDVVLPLPGYDVVYPEGEMGSWYQELMKKDGLDVDNMRQKHKDYSLPGDYRHLVVIPTEVTWETIRYNDHTIPLAQGDLDILFNKPKPEGVKDGKFRALRLEMTLPPSTYATMALREVLKTDTSSAFQSTLNVT